MTLRDRLLALADDCELIRGDLVLAAARLALEEAERAADKVGDLTVGQCIGLIRAMRDGLG